MYNYNRILYTVYVLHYITQAQVFSDFDEESILTIQPKKRGFLKTAGICILAAAVVIGGVVSAKTVLPNFITLDTGINSQISPSVQPVQKSTADQPEITEHLPEDRKLNLVLTQSENVPVYVKMSVNYLPEVVIDHDDYKGKSDNWGVDYKEIWSEVQLGQKIGFDDNLEKLYEEYGTPNKCGVEYSVDEIEVLDNISDLDYSHFEGTKDINEMIDENGNFTSYTREYYSWNEEERQESVPDSAVNIEVRLAIEKLKPKIRVVIVMKYIEGFSVKAIKDILKKLNFQV